MRFLFRSIAGFVLLAFPTLTFAYDIDPCALWDIGLVCNPDLSEYVESTIIHGRAGLMMTFGGILFAMLVFYGVRLAFGSEDEEILTATKQAYGHALLGAVLVTAAYTISWAFLSPRGVMPTGAVYMEPLVGLGATVMVFFKGVLFAMLVGNFFYQGFLLIVAQDDATRERARKLMLWGMIGAAMVMLSNAAAEAFFSRNIGIISIELAGLLNFLATIFGFLSVVAIIVAGILIMTALEDSAKERGKKILLASFISLIVVICSAALVNTFLI